MIQSGLYRMLCNCRAICLAFLIVSACVVAEEPAEAVPLDPVPTKPNDSSTEKLKEKQSPKKDGEQPQPQPTPEPKPIPVPPVPNPNAEPKDPPAETVPLPAEKPLVKPDGTKTAKNAQPVVEDEAPSLSVETPAVAPGQEAIFSLYGPETQLRASGAQYSLRDEYDREVARGVLKVAELPYSEGKPRQIKLPIRDALGQQYAFKLNLTFPDGKQNELKSTFSISNAGAADALPIAPQWDRWMTLIAIPPANGNWSALRELGVRGGMQYRLNPARREALRKAGMSFYVENIARQTLSRYHTEAGLWAKTVAAMQADPGNRAALSREPSLCSQQFAEAFASELKKHSDVYSKDPPLFYSLASEPSVTNLSAAADFDFSPSAIAEFQRWLERDVYGTVKALNAAWGTEFKTWTEVQPMLTDEARLRFKDGVMNFGPWIDFREFQDYIFSKTLRDAGDYIRRDNRTAKVGITGALGAFAFGGWDWARLSNALDVVECYDIASARNLWRDLAPGKPAMAVLPLSPDEKIESALPDATRTLWKFALEGGPRAALLWDEPGENGGSRALLNNDGTLAPLGKALTPVLQTLDGEAGALLANSVHADDGVALLYSPASIRLHWFFEANQLHGNEWLKAWGADTAAERRESYQLRLRESWEKILDDLGLGWRYVSTAQIENKVLQNPESAIKTLVLSQTLCLSEREIDLIKQFVANGGKIVADAACGRFDEHGKLRDKPALDEILEIDTSSEPFLAQPMNPLERIQGKHANFSAETIDNLAPVFSDRPKLIAKTPALEYRRSPVLHASKAAAYLNLDLADYVRWRLHPDQPRAKAVLDALKSVAFSDRIAESVVDFAKSKLPIGTQLVWLKTRGAQAGARVLALRRNPQARLHELGTESDGNWAFEKTEPFTLVFKKSMFIFPVLGGNASRKSESRQLVQGELDPASPALFVINAAAPKSLKISAPAQLPAGNVLEVTINSEAGNEACLYRIQLSGPNGFERSCYANFAFAANGNLTHRIPLAFNDPTGKWQINIVDLLHGAEATGTFDLKGE